jgi:hypothetical protein
MKCALWAARACRRSSSASLDSFSSTCARRTPGAATLICFSCHHKCPMLRKSAGPAAVPPWQHLRMLSPQMPGQ